MVSCSCVPHLSFCTGNTSSGSEVYTIRIRAVCVSRTVLVATEDVRAMSHSAAVMDFALEEDEEQAAFDAALSFLDEFEPLVAARDEGSIDVLGIGRLDDDDEGEGGTAAQAGEVGNGPAQAFTPSAVALNVSKGIKAKRAKTGEFNPNRARDEQKKELLYLRSKVAEMETQLEELKRAGSSENYTSASSVIAKSAARLLAGKPTVAMLTRGGRIRASSRPQFVWEEIASRQYAERHKAELENVKLKMMLEGQIKVAKSLESVLKKRSTTQVRG